MKFEYDGTKSFKNKQKHGIDFKEVTNIWKNEKAKKIGVTRQSIVNLDYREIKARADTSQLA